MGALANLVPQSMITNKSPFWGKYKNLNKVRTPNEEMIKNYQLQKLAELQKQSLKEQALSHSKASLLINTLFNNKAINNIDSLYKQNQQVSLQEAITNIVTDIGETRQAFYKKSATRKEQDAAVVKNLKSLSSSLENIIQELELKGSVTGNYLKKLNDIIAKTDLNHGDIVHFIKTINQYQGDIVEDLGVDWFNKRIPKDLHVKAVNVGKLVLNSKEGRKQGQLIQDLLLIDMDLLNLDDYSNIPISYTLGGKKEELPLRDFLEKIQTYDGDEGMIVIEDFAYTTLMQLSALNIQSKSGLKQLPWNQNKSTSIALGEITTEANIGIPVIKAFNLLIALNQENPKDKWIEPDINEEYKLMANYGIATLLHKVLHLSANEGNQYLLTPSGFITFYERMVQIFEKNNNYFKVTKKVILKDESSLTEKYRVTVNLREY